MTTDIRNLISRMADELDHYRQLLSDDRREVHALAAEARAALATEPVGEGLSGEDLLKTYCDARRAFYFEAAEGESDQEDRKAATIAGLRAVLARWARSAALAEPVGEGPNPDYARVPQIATKGEIRAAALYLIKKKHLDGDLISAIEYAIARWGLPAAPPAPEVGSAAALATWLRRHSGQCVELGRPDWAHMADRAAYMLEAFRLGGWIVPTVEDATPPTPEPGEVGEGPSHGDICQFLEQQGHWGDNAHRIPRVANMVQSVLARWGHPAAPPAPEVGEMGEVVAALKVIDKMQQEWVLLGNDDDGTASPSLSMPISLRRFTVLRDALSRAATLLQQQAAPAPVAVSGEVHFEFAVVDGDCIQQASGTAPTYSQALSEGRHYLAEYLQNGLHTLEIRRIEQLPQGGEGE